MRDRKENLNRAADKAATIELRGMAWPIYEGYEDEARERELPGGEIERSVWLVAPPPKFRLTAVRDEEGHSIKVREGDEEHQVEVVQCWEQDWGVKKVYAPLRRPDLLLRLADLGESGRVSEEEMIARMKGWAYEFGLLGVSDDEGRSESLFQFFIEARKVARILRLYEAASFPNGPKIEALERYGVQGRTPHHLKNAALEEVGDTVAACLRNRTYLVPYRQVSRETGEIKGFVEGYGFRNLLGAVYIMMMWLMKADNAARRCKRAGCPRIITFEVPEYAEATEVPRINPNTGKPYVRGPYKTRVDKKFCSPACKRNWRYHNVEKPANSKR